MTSICNSDKDCVSKDTFGNCHSFDFCKHKSFNDIEKVNNPITFKVESVMCDYGIYENDQLMMIVNSRANALLIKSILQQDLKGKTRFQRLKETHPKLYDYCLNGGEFVNGIWQPNKQGLGMRYVFDELNNLYGNNFIRYE